MNFKKWNVITGWAVFLLAAVVYLMTMEPTSSMWDCSEFIATSYKLEVGHPPGAPLFMLMARIATLFAPSTQYVPMMVNAMNCLASAFCILFLFWTITHLARRLYTRGQRSLTESESWAVLGAGIVGALAYVFTDSFWFSAVEGEVYALSSMFTALVVWLMLCWEEEADQPHAMRWIILIAYLMGLSIGVHILNLLTIPALVFIYYFRRTKKVEWKGITKATLLSGVLLLFINSLIIPYTVYLGAMVDVLFVNSFGLPVNSGIVIFCLGIFAALGWSVWYTHKRGFVIWNTLLLATTVILIGYSSYASVTIRAAANPPMNSNNPNNPHALLSLLSRDQYGDRPLLYGAYYSAPIEDTKGKDLYYLDDDGKYKQTTILNSYIHPPQFMHLFPRMWDYRKGEEAYKPWAAHRTKEETARDRNNEIIRDEAGNPLSHTVVDFGERVRYRDGFIIEPTFRENLNYFVSYQLFYMYWRYFLWNFVGRQSDIQASGSTIADGNWLSGIKSIDQHYLGPQENLPHEVAENRGRNTYYFLPFLLGLIGLIYQLNRDQRNFTVVMWLFIMMGIALVVYFNSSPSEPRERDYVYAGSFYAFCIWIGFGVLALRDGLAALLRKDRRLNAAIATLVCLVVPGILAAQNWDDHDRSNRTMAHDIGWNYLQSTLPNSIILNYGDNDTFPLWLNQEVDSVRLDVRIMNTSYLGGEWYIDEMKIKSNHSAPVPFSLPRSKYAYVNDMLLVDKRLDRAIDLREAIDFIRSDDPRTKITLNDNTLSDYLPANRFALPVNKENAIASGIVKEADRDLMVDTIYFDITKQAIDKSEMMLLDLLANFDWKRPIFFTQPYILQSLSPKQQSADGKGTLSLMDYLQFDGYGYRLVPIFTPYTSAGEIGRVDPDYTLPLLTETFRFGNLDNPKVYVDNFIQNNLSASRTREAFARTAKELIRRGDKAKAIELLDLGLKKLPTAQIRYTDANTYPFIEAYYAAGATEKGDQLLSDYAQTLMEYIDYYLGFEGYQADLVQELMYDRLDSLEHIYLLAGYAGRAKLVDALNEYFRSLGYRENELINTGGAPSTDSLSTPTNG
ncbi:MAG: DUF2723 domain-containing protein [Alistipes sp.]